MEETLKECLLRYCYTSCAISNNERFTKINTAFLDAESTYSTVVLTSSRTVWFQHFTSFCLLMVESLCSTFGCAEPNIILGLRWLHGNLSLAWLWFTLLFCCCLWFCSVIEANLWLNCLWSRDSYGLMAKLFLLRYAHALAVVIRLQEMIF